MPILALEQQTADCILLTVTADYHVKIQDYAASLHFPGYSRLKMQTRHRRRITFAVLGFPDGPVVYMKSPQPLAGRFFRLHFGRQASLPPRSDEKSPPYRRAFHA